MSNTDLTTQARADHLLREIGIALICAAVRYHACRFAVSAGEYRGYYWREADA